MPNKTDTRTIRALPSTVDKIKKLAADYDKSADQLDFILRDYERLKTLSRSWETIEVLYEILRQLNPNLAGFLHYQKVLTSKAYSILDFNSDYEQELINITKDNISLIDQFVKDRNLEDYISPVLLVPDW